MDRVGQKWGIIMVWDMHAKVIKREEIKIEKARKALE